MSRETPLRRRFTLADGMVLVAAVALCLSLTGWFWRWMAPMSIRWGSPVLALSDLASGLLIATFPSATVATWTLMILRRLPPRPPRVVLARQPGALVVAAGGLPALTLNAACLVTVAYFIRSGGRSMSGPFLILFGMPGVAVASIWLTLWRDGLIAREQDWIEWVGRLLGFYWMAVTLLLEGILLFLG